MKKTLVILSAVLVSAASFFIASCKKSEKNTITLYSRAGYIPSSVIEKFEAEYGAKVKIKSFDSSEKMFKEVCSSKDYDVVISPLEITSKLIDKKVLSKINMEKFPNKSKINPKCLSRVEIGDKEMTYSVPFCMSAVGIIVNKKNVKDYPRNYTIFQKKDYTGHMTMLNDMRISLGAALKQCGYSLNTTDKAQIKEAAKLLKYQWAPNLLKFDSEDYGKMLAAGNFWVCQGNADVVLNAVAENEQKQTVDFFVPEAGAPACFDSFVIPKKTQNYDLAMKFIDFCHKSEIYAEILDSTRAPAYINLEAEKFTKKKPLYSRSTLSRCEIILDTGDASELYRQSWENIKF